MLKKTLSAAISVILALALCIGTCSSAFAASSGKKYVKEVILSYGDTVEDAITWLSDHGYEAVDNNLNEGADDAFTSKRAVCLGYKTTSKASEAITDMKLMNMKGGYSIQDYQMLLSEQKDNIKIFFDDFKVAVQEYRDNYNAGQQRAIAAYDMLNMLYDDDTQQNLGDLLLSKVREEYTDEEYNALSAKEQAKVGDMTTILMQGNADAILAMEQIIASATDETDTMWTERYQQAKTYDEMLDELMESEDLTVNEAEKELALKYDDDAKKIANNLSSYYDYLGVYLNSGITIKSTTEEVEAYQKANENFSFSEWFAAGTQYEAIKALKNDDISLYDLISNADYNVAGEGRTLLYPLVSVLTDGQRACLDFLPMYQIVAIGINDDSMVKEAMESANITQSEVLKNVSIYDGVDRSIFGADVALTGDAYKLQASTGKNAVGLENRISTTSIVLWSVFATSAIITGLCWMANSKFLKISTDLANEASQKAPVVESAVNKIKVAVQEMKLQGANLMDTLDTNRARWALEDKQKALVSNANSAEGFCKFFKYAGVAMTCITAVLLAFSIWNTVEDLMDYYNTDFTPIPSIMVNQGVNENDEKVFTYYKAVKCNRDDQNMITDSTRILGDYGDLNGDVGKQWVALYTTTDSAAGDPITTDFKVQYKDTNVPGERTPLSIFCESVAQNLTNNKLGYTYADSKGGIYLFYGTDENALTGSVISDGAYYILVGGGCAIVAAAIAFFVGKSVGKKDKKKEDTVNA